MEEREEMVRVIHHAPINVRVDVSAEAATIRRIEAVPTLRIKPALVNTTFQAPANDPDELSVAINATYKTSTVQPIVFQDGFPNSSTGRPAVPNSTANSSRHVDRDAEAGATSTIMVMGIAIG